MDTVKLMNVLIIKYSLHCNLLSSNVKTRIYIYRSSLEHLISIIEPVLMFRANNMTKERLSFICKWLYEILDCKAYSNSERKTPAELQQVQTPRLIFFSSPQKGDWPLGLDPYFFFLTCNIKKKLGTIPKG
jgi:hypothetical protein